MYPAFMNPRVFFAHRQGFAELTRPHLSFMKLCKSRRARLSRWRKFSGLISQELRPDGVTNVQNLAKDVHQALSAIQAEQHARRTADLSLFDEEPNVNWNARLVRKILVRRVVQPMRVTAECESFGLQATTLHIQDVVDGDTVQPCSKAASALEGHKSGQRLDEDFLGRILRVMRVCDIRRVTL